MAKRLSVNGDIFIGSKEVDGNNPFVLAEEEGGWTPGWVEMSANPEFSGSFSPFLLPIYAEGFDNFGYYMVMVDGYSSSCFVPSSPTWVRCPIPRFTSTYYLRPHTGACSPPAEYIEGECNLTINYKDGSTFDYGTVPCDAEVFLLDDICCPQSIKLADKVISLL